MLVKGIKVVEVISFNRLSFIVIEKYLLPVEVN